LQGNISKVGERAEDVYWGWKLSNKVKQDDNETDRRISKQRKGTNKEVNTQAR
jgi:hypothetical protein